VFRFLALLAASLSAGCGPGLFVSEVGRGIYAQIYPSVVAVEVPVHGGMSVGSGVVTGPGQVLTACHVLTQVTGLRVRFAGRPYTATVSRAMSDADLCELAVPGLPARPVVSASANGLNQGDALYALAIPGGYRVEMSEGVLSRIVHHREREYIETTARFAPGWSGGGLFNARCELVGMLAFILTGPEKQFNYAIPVDQLSAMASGR
jgi:S1-C subfamily serine protease